jgi:hypothetical protein
MKKLVVVICSLMLALGLSGCVGKGPIGKAKPRPRSLQGVNSSTQTVSRGQNLLISLTDLAGVMSGCYPENRSTPKWGI